LNILFINNIKLIICSYTAGSLIGKIDLIGS